MPRNGNDTTVWPAFSAVMCQLSSPSQEWAPVLFDVQHGVIISSVLSGFTVIIPSTGTTERVTQNERAESWKHQRYGDSLQHVSSCPCFPVPVNAPVVTEKTQTPCHTLCWMFSSLPTLRALHHNLPLWNKLIQSHRKKCSQRYPLSSHLRDKRRRRVDHETLVSREAGTRTQPVHGRVPEGGKLEVCRDPVLARDGGVVGQR